MLLTVEKRTWRESRGAGWSETLYSGMYVVLNRQPLLVSKLSHGLRVLLISDEAKYRFETKGPTIPVCNSFLIEVEAALKADHRFQNQVQEYDRIMSS